MPTMEKPKSKDSNNKNVRFLIQEKRIDYEQTKLKNRTMPNNFTSNT